MVEFFKVLSAVLPVFLIALLGFQLRRMDWLTKAADDSLLKVSVNVLLPCLAFSNISNNPELLKPENVWLPPVIGFLLIGVGIAVGWLVRKFATGSTDAKGRTFAISIGVFNFGFVPIPLVASLFGESAVGVLFVFNVGTLLAMWSLGVMLLHGDLRTGFRKAINVPVVTVVAALVVNATGLHEYIPVLANDTIKTLGLCGIPMSILLIGAMVKDHFAECDFRSSFRVCWVSVVLRLGLLPLTMIALAKWLAVLDRTAAGAARCSSNALSDFPAADRPALRRQPGCRHAGSHRHYAGKSGNYSFVVAGRCSVHWAGLRCSVALGLAAIPACRGRSVRVGQGACEQSCFSQPSVPYSFSPVCLRTIR